MLVQPAERVARVDRPAGGQGEQVAARIGRLLIVDGRVIDQETPYPGSNLFSLASGGAIYARDPFGRLDEHQLNGGRYAELTDEDWALIRPYLEENERLFGIPLEALLTVDGRRRPPHDVYRKVEPRELAVLK